MAGGNLMVVLDNQEHPLAYRRQQRHFIKLTILPTEIGMIKGAKQKLFSLERCFK